MKRTISGMVGKGSLAHNRRSFIAENVNPERVESNIKYCDDNLKQIYHELFDDAVARYNVGKRKDRQIHDYYDKIQHGKQEKLFHEVIFQIGNSKDMAVATPEGKLATEILDEFVKGFQARNPSLRVFNCYVHLDEATPHVHIDFVPFVTNWKGKGMDTRVSLKQALKSQGFQGGSKHESELNQWINHEKEILAQIMEQHGIEWEKKGTHEEHLDVYNYKKKERQKELACLEQEQKELSEKYLNLLIDMREKCADVHSLGEEKTRLEQDNVQMAEQVRIVATELEHIGKRREKVQTVMNAVDQELEKFGQVDLLLPQPGSLERAVTYREKKIKPLFTKMKQYMAALAGKVLEMEQILNQWKRKHRNLENDYCELRDELKNVVNEKNQLKEENHTLRNTEMKYQRVRKILGLDVVEQAEQRAIHLEYLEENSVNRRWSKRPENGVRGDEKKEIWSYNIWQRRLICKVLPKFGKQVYINSLNIN